MATATARWNDYATDRDLISGGTYSIIIEFSESVTGLSSGTLVFAPDYTITGDTSRFRYSSGSGTTYIYIVYLTSDPGSIRIQLDHDAVTPNLDEDFDWTLGWLADGSTYTYPTNQVGGSELAITLDTDYVAAGELVLATFTFSRDIPVLPISAINLTEGLTLEGGGSPNNRVWTQRIRVPATGNGVGVVSIAENAIFPPGNDAASASFTYIDTINADISLSAASAQNGETILAQFDFDYDVPNFSSSFINAGSEGNSVLGAGNQALELGGQILGIPSTSAVASVGTAVALSDDNRSWQVPIAVPVSGEGMLEIELPEDAIGFQSAAVMAEVQFAPIINRNIAINNGQKYLAIIGKDFSQNIGITGNNISSVDVQGLLRPFYHQWNSTTGTLSIIGKPTSYYKDLEFEVIAADTNGTSRAKATIDVIDIAPAIIKPAQRLKVIAGRKNEIPIRINNNPREVDVKGTWMNLDHKLDETGIIIEGDVPSKGLGVDQGMFIVNASNDGGSAAETEIPWSISPDTNAYVYYSNGRNVYKITQAAVEDWSYTAITGSFGNFDVALDNSGNFLVNIVVGATGNTLYKIGEEGALLWSTTYSTTNSGISMVIDSDNNIILYASGILIKFNESTGVEEYKNTSATSNVQGVYGFNIILDNNNDIILYNLRNGDIYKYSNSTGNRLWANTSIPAIGTLSNPHFTDAVIDSSNNILIRNVHRNFLVLDGNRGDIYKINGSTGALDWTHTSTFRGSLSNTLILDSNDDILVMCPSGSNTNFLHKVGSDGTALWNLQIMPNAPVGFQLLVDSQGDVIVIDLGAGRLITKVGSSGSQSWHIDEDISSTGEYILDSEDNLYIVNRDNRVNNQFAVRKRNRFGNIVWTIGPGTPVGGVDRLPNNLDTYGANAYLLGDDSLYIFNHGTKRLYNITASGEVAWTYEGFRTINPSGNYQVFVP